VSRFGRSFPIQPRLVRTLAAPVVAATMAAAAGFGGTPTATPAGSATMAGAAGFGGTGSYAATAAMGAVASFGGTAATTPTAAGTMAGAASFGGTSTATATGTGGLTGVATFGGAGSYAAAGTMAGVASFTSTTPIAGSSGQMGAVGTFGGTPSPGAPVSMAGVASFGGAGSYAVSATMAGAGGFGGIATPTPTATATMAGVASFTGAVTGPPTAVATMAAVASLASTPGVGAPAAMAGAGAFGAPQPGVGSPATLAAVAGFGGTGALNPSGAALMAAQAALTVTGTLNPYAGSGLIATAQFGALTPAPMTPPFDLQLRALDGPGGGPGTILPDAHIEFVDNFCDVGSIKVDYPRTGLNAGWLVDQAGFCLFSQGAELPNSRWYVEDGTGDDAQDDLGGGGADSYAGQNLVGLFSQGIVYPAGWPSVTNPSSHSFTGATIGTIMRTLVQRAQARGALTGITVSSFTDTADSNGQPWAFGMTVTYDAGTNLLQVLQNAYAQGVVEFQTVGRSLRMYNPGTLSTDRTTGAQPAILRRGRDVTGAGRQRSSRSMMTTVLIEGDQTSMVEIVDPKASGPLGRREGYVAQSGVTDTGTLRVIGQSTLGQKNGPRTQRTFGLDLSAGGPRPWVDYLVGDYLWADVGNQLEKLRVVSLNATKDPDGMVIATVVLNDRFLELDVLLARRVSGISGGSSGIASVAPLNSTTPDRLAPAVPAGLGATSTAFVSPDGITQAQLTASWAAVTTNADGTACTDLDHYEVQATVGGQVLNLGSTTTATLSYSPVRPGLNVAVRVRAVDQNGNRSPFCSDYTLTAGSDVTPPPVPSTPTVVAMLGALRAVWDGHGSAGEVQPGDFDRVEVHASTVVGFTPSAATLQDTIRSPYGGTSVLLLPFVQFYVRLVAFDHSGNASAPSAAAPGTPRQARGGNTSLSAGSSAGAMSISTGLSIPGGTAITVSAGTASAETATTSGTPTGTGPFTVTLTGPLVRAHAQGDTVSLGDLGTLSITDAEIQTLNATKITTGILSADLVVGGRIKTSDTGARVEINNAGLSAYGIDGTTRTAFLSDADGSLTINKGTITGAMIQTAATGQRMVLTGTGGSFAATAAYLYTGLAGENASGVMGVRLVPGFNTKTLDLIPPEFGLSDGSHSTSLSLAGRTSPSSGTDAIVSVFSDRFHAQSPDGTWNMDAYGSNWVISSGIGATAASIVGTPGSGVNSIKIGAPTLMWVSDGASGYRPVYASAYNVASARALKTDVVELLGALDELRRLRPVEYRNADKADIEWHDGLHRSLIAEDVAAVIPHASPPSAQGEPSGGLSLMTLLATTIAAVQELDRKVHG